MHWLCSRVFPINIAAEQGRGSGYEEKSTGSTVNIPTVCVIRLPGDPLEETAPSLSSTKRLRTSCYANGGIYVIHRYQDPACHVWLKSDLWRWLTSKEKEEEKMFVHLHDMLLQSASRVKQSRYMPTSAAAMYYVLRVICSSRREVNAEILGKCGQRNTEKLLMPRKKWKCRIIHPIKKMLYEGWASLFMLSSERGKQEESYPHCQGKW